MGMLEEKLLTRALALETAVAGLRQEFQAFSSEERKLLHALLRYAEGGPEHRAVLRRMLQLLDIPAALLENILTRKRLNEPEGLREPQ
jgi:hypothetical protein